MCGIAGYAVNKSHRSRFHAGHKLSAALLLEIEDRGKHATGFLSVAADGRKKKPKTMIEKDDKQASDFIKTHMVDPRAHTALLHTRHMTKGDPAVMANNHPVNYKTCFVIHNGSIYNDADLLKDAGVEAAKRVGEVDSFAIPVVLETMGWGNADDVEKALGSIRGPFAIAALDILNPSRILLAKGENQPLWTLSTPSGLYWASTRTAITKAWTKAMGTPPIANAQKPGDFGFYSFAEGEYWVVDTEILGAHLDIQPGRFTVKKYTQTTGFGAHATTHYQPYRSRQTAKWTCWPDTKDCIFGHDCGSCENDNCQCFSGNPEHPKINENTDYDTATKEWPTFRSHCTNHNLLRGVIDNRPTQGSAALVVLPNTIRVTDTKSSTTSSTTEGSTCTTEACETTKLTKIKCFFCGSVAWSDAVSTLNPAAVTMGMEAILECFDCRDAHRDVDDDVYGLGDLDNEKQTSFLKANNDRAVQWIETVECAAKSSAMELNLTPQFVLWAVMLHHAGLGPEHLAFCKEVKTSFEENFRFMKEYQAVQEGEDA